jgi:hypothetical protein
MTAQEDLRGGGGPATYLTKTAGVGRWGDLYFSNPGFEGAK